MSQTCEVWKSLEPKTVNWKQQTDLGVPQATQGAGFSGLRFAPVPMKDRHLTLTIPNAKPTFQKPMRYSKTKRSALE